MNEVLNKISKQSPHLSWIKDNTIFLTVHGSRCYGTNIETSDYDYKGVCIPTKEYFYSPSLKFEQAELKDPDSVIYEIRKFFNLASSCNPNILEVLYTDPSDHLIVTPLGQKLLDNKDKFLSKRVRYSFAGYAHAQLKRIKSHRKWILNPVQTPPTRKELGLPEQTVIPQDQLMAAQAEIQKEMDKFSFNFMENLDEASKIMVQGTMIDMLAELKITSEQHWEASARKIGFDDNFIHLMQKEREYTGKKREYDQYQNWKVTRNVERAEDEAKYGFDLKHAYHLVRLIRMAKEMISEGKVIVKRPDREELLHIRNGGWTYDQIVEFAEKEEKELDVLYKTSEALPYKPDIKALDNLCVSLIEESLAK